MSHGAEGLVREMRANPAFAPYADRVKDGLADLDIRGDGDVGFIRLMDFLLEILGRADRTLEQRFADLAAALPK